MDIAVSLAGTLTGGFSFSSLDTGHYCLARWEISGFLGWERVLVVILDYLVFRYL